MARLDTIRAIENISGKIDHGYDMRVTDMYKIADAYKDRVEQLYAAFKFGYVQGIKSAKVKNSVSLAN